MGTQFINPGSMSEDEIEELESIDNVFVGIDSMKRNTTKNLKRTGLKKSHPKKPCPLKCPKEVHTNGSLYFCPLFRDKSKEERSLLQEKTHCCKQCLSRVKKGHDCPVGKCKNCGMGHNILLCPKDQEDCKKIFQVNEESSSDEFTEDKTNDSANQEEMVFLTRKIKGAKIEGKHNNGETNKKTKMKMKT